MCADTRLSRMGPVQTSEQPDRLYRRVADTVIAALKAGGDAGSADTEDLSVGACELVEARIVIEGDTAGLAAGAARPDDIAFLRDCVALMNDHDPAVCEQADRAFHLHIAAMTANSALTAAVELMWGFCLFL